MKIITKQKLSRLQTILKDMQSVLVAYSGGVDSTFLLKAAKDVLGDSVFAVIGQSATYPQREQKQAVSFVKKLKIPYSIIQTKELSNKKFLRNPKNRCFWCKDELFGKLSKIAKNKNLNFVLDGSNFDDLSDFRPGFKAKHKWKVRSPLIEAKLTKHEIRQISKQWELPTWDKPAFACLSSRFPYGSDINRDALEKIDKAEDYLLKLGLKQVRLRHHDYIARIETDKQGMNIVFENRNKISKYLKKLGYTFVDLNLEEYKSGSMNLM